MNTTVKIILGIVAGIIVVCLCLGAFGLLMFRSTSSVIGRTLQTGATQVVDVSGSIAGYTLPDGFGPAYAIRIVDFSFISYTGDDAHSHIMFFQLPAGVHLDQAEIERQMRQASRDGGVEWNMESEVVDEVPATINGQEVTLVVSEGINHEGQPFRQVSGMFQGRGGQAVVVYEAPTSAWDQAEVDQFLASIH